MFGSFDNFGVKGNAKSKRSITARKFISPLQLIFWKWNFNCVFGSMMGFSLTDFFSINKSDIFAAEIADADIRRIDI